MLKVNLSEKLKTDQEQKESLLEGFDPKVLLLDAYQKEQEIFNSLGFKSNSITKVHENDVKRTVMARSIYGKASFIGRDLKKLCVEYDLKLLPASYYNGDVPIEVARIVSDFCEKHSVLPNSDNFFILAPSEMFNNEKFIPRNMDPILFYREKTSQWRHEDLAQEPELFTQIHNWGNDFSFMRRYRFMISDYQKSRDEMSNRQLTKICLFFTVLSIIASIILAMPLIAIVGFIISCFLAVGLEENIFEHTWNNNLI